MRETPPVDDPDHYFMEWLPAQLAPHTKLEQRLATAGEIAQIELSGERGGVWHFVLAGERIVFTRGPHASPSFVILMSVETWRDLTLEKISAAGAWIRRKIKTRGSLRAMMRVGRLFND